MSNKESAKEQLLNAALSLIEEGKSISVITIRDITGRAGLATGLVNYYFGSKENLFLSLLAEKFFNDIKKLRDDCLSLNKNPKEKLIHFLQRINERRDVKPEIIKFILQSVILMGIHDIEELIIPFVREINPNLSPPQQKLKSFQLIVPLQVMSLNPEGFGAFIGVDIMDSEERDLVIKTMINNIFIDDLQ